MLYIIGNNSEASVSQKAHTRFLKTQKNWNAGALWMTLGKIKESENFFQTTRLISVSSARGMAHQVSFSDFLRQTVYFLSPEKPSIITSRV